MRVRLTFEFNRREREAIAREKARRACVAPEPGALASHKECQAWISRHAGIAMDLALDRAMALAEDDLAKGA